jgi:hypothetical protein
VQAEDKSWAMAALLLRMRNLCVEATGIGCSEYRSSRWRLLQLLLHVDLGATQTWARLAT